MPRKSRRKRSRAYRARRKSKRKYRARGLRPKSRRKSKRSRAYRARGLRPKYRRNSRAYRARRKSRRSRAYRARRKSRRSRAYRARGLRSKSRRKSRRRFGSTGGAQTPLDRFAELKRRYDALSKLSDNMKRSKERREQARAMAQEVKPKMHKAALEVYNAAGENVMRDPIATNLERQDEIHTRFINRKIKEEAAAKALDPGLEKNQSPKRLAALNKELFLKKQLVAQLRKLKGTEELLKQQEQNMAMLYAQQKL